MKQCLLCQKRIVENFSFKWLFSFQTSGIKQVCSTCINSFDSLKGKAVCTGCGRPGNYQNYCTDCEKWVTLGAAELLCNRSLYCYNRQMKEYFERFKFSGDYYLRLVFQKELEAKLKENYHKGWLFVPIPVSKEVFEKRGFNQVEGLFENICLSKMLSVKKISKKQQSLLKRRERMQAAQPFELTTGFEKEIKGKNILLLDDIYTTGRTLYHAQALLKKAGAKKVHSVTLAR